MNFTSGLCQRVVQVEQQPFTLMPNQVGIDLPPGVL